MANEKRRDKKGRVLRSGESQRSDGRYMYRYVDSFGKRRYIYSWKLVATDVPPRDRREDRSLREMESDIEADLRSGLDTRAAQSTTFDTVFHKFVSIRKDLRATTLSQYQDLYERHVKPELGHRLISAITGSDLLTLFESCVYNKGMTIASVRNLRSVVTQVFDLAVDDHVILENPCAWAFKRLSKTVKDTSKKRDGLSEEEQDIFLKEAYADENQLPLALMITVLLGTGMRIGECLGLQWSDVDFKNSVIHIRHNVVYRNFDGEGYEFRVNEPKTTAGARDIPMMADVEHALLRFRQDQLQRDLPDFRIDGYDDFVFRISNGRLPSSDLVNIHFRQIVNRYNKRESKAALEEKRDPVLLPNISCHILRHTFATRMCELGANPKFVQAIMGHASFDLTMDVYTTATPKFQRQELDRLDGKIRLA